MRAEDDTYLWVEGQTFRDCWDGLLVLVDSPAIAMVSLSSPLLLPHPLRSVSRMEETDNAAGHSSSVLLKANLV